MANVFAKVKGVKKKAEQVELFVCGFTLLLKNTQTASHGYAACELTLTH